MLNKKLLTYSRIAIVGYVEIDIKRLIKKKWMQKTSTKGVKDWIWLGREGDQLRIVQEIKIWPH